MAITHRWHVFLRILTGKQNSLLKKKVSLQVSGLPGRFSIQPIKTLKLDVVLEDSKRGLSGRYCILPLAGRQQSILKSERLVLNIMQRMSGIATSTREYVSRLKGLKTKILDTRKTTPGFRFLEKEAVRIGGGMNHRMGLFDMIMLKDNHIDYAGGIEKAIIKARVYLKKNNLNLKIEIEARNSCRCKKDTFSWRREPHHARQFQY